MASKSGHNDFYQDGRELLLRTRLAGKKISENKQASMQYTKEQEDAKAAQWGGAWRWVQKFNGGANVGTQVGSAGRKQGLSHKPHGKGLEEWDSHPYSVMPYMRSVPTTTHEEA